MLNNTDRERFMGIATRFGLSNPNDKQLFGLYAFGVLRNYLMATKVNDIDIRWTNFYAKSFKIILTEEDVFPFKEIDGFDRLIIKENPSQMLCEFIDRKSFDDFIRIVVPSLAGMPQELYRKIRSFKMPNPSNIAKDVWITLQFLMLLQDKTATEFDSIEDGYQQYVDFYAKLSDNAKTLAGGAAISQKQYADLFKLRYQYLISASSSVEGTYDLLHKIFQRPAEMCEAFYNILSFSNAYGKNEIKSPYKYYQKIYSIDHDMSVGDYEKTFNHVFNIIKGGTVQPIDFLDVVINHARTSDSMLEVDFVYREVFAHGVSNRILLINPSVSFLKKALLTFDSSVSVEVVLSEKAYYDLLSVDKSMQRPGLSISYYGTFGDNPSGEYSTICLFATPMPPVDLIHKAIASASFGARILTLLASKDRYSFVDSMSASKIAIEFIHVLSAKCTSTSPKKKVLIDARAYSPKLARIPVRFYETREDLSVDIAATAKQTSINYVEWRTKKTLSYIVAAQKETPIEKQRDARKEFIFSKEISVWYSSYPGSAAVRYRICLCNKRKPGDYNPRKGYGQIIPETKRNKSFPPSSTIQSELEEYISKEYLFDPIIRSIEIDQIKKELQQSAALQSKKARMPNGKSGRKMVRAPRKDLRYKVVQKKVLPVIVLSFKTFWYVYFDSFRNQREQIRKAIEELACGVFRDENVANITESACVSLMDSFNADTEDRQESFWDALDLLLSLAVAKGLRESNPIASVFSARKYWEAEYAAVRSALVRKSLTVGQTETLIEYLQRQRNDPYAVAVMIRLFTGMPAAEIAALRENDLIKHKNLPVYFLAVHGVIKPGDASPSPFDRKEKYRRIPLIAPLEEVLLPLMGNDETRPLLKYNDNQLSERVIREKSQKALRFVGIGSDIIEIPRDDGSTETTDLDAYSLRSDFFRESFKIFAKDQCRFSIAEIDYLLGNTQKTTYASNYCDFSNPFSQIKLQRKLWRGFSKFFLPAVSPQIVKARRNTLSFNRSGTALKYDVDIPLGASSAEIQVDSDYGFSYSISSLEGGNNNYE